MTSLVVLLMACSHAGGPANDAMPDQPKALHPTKLDVLVVMSLGEDGSDFSQYAGANITKMMQRLLAPPDQKPITDFHIGVVTSKINHASAKMPPGCEVWGAHPQDGYLVQPSRAGGAVARPPGWVPEWPWPANWTYLSQEQSSRFDLGELLWEYLYSAFISGCTDTSGWCNVTEYLEVARLATDGRNGDFLRADSLLVIIFLADWEDCSTDNASLWDPTLWGDKYRYSNHQCYDPPGDLIYPIDRYVSYLSSFHPGGRIMLGMVGVDSQPVWTTSPPPDPAHLEVKTMCTIGPVPTVLPTLRIPEVMRRLQAQNPTIDTFSFDPCAVYTDTTLMLPMADRILEVMSR